MASPLLRGQLEDDLTDSNRLQGTAATATAWNCGVASAGGWPRAAHLFASGPQGQVPGVSSRRFHSARGLRLDSVSLGSLLHFLPWKGALEALRWASARFQRG